MLRNPCSQIFRSNKLFFTEIWDFQKKGNFQFSKKTGKSYSFYFSAILQPIFLNNVSFEREKKTEPDGVLSYVKIVFSVQKISEILLGKMEFSYIWLKMYW
jgi:hypothetical protein